MSKILGAYYGAWEPIDRIDPTLCNFAYFSFFETDCNGKITTNHSDKINDFINLKRKNSSIKLIAAIGGYNAGTYGFANMAKNRTTRSCFISNCMELIRTYGFDGIDIDWEFPVVGGADGGQTVADKQNFVTLLSELKKVMDANRKYLTVAVSAGEWTVKQAYDIKGISDNVDMINIMTYDYQWPKDRTGHNAPIDEVNKSVQYWIDHGCQASKIVLGLAAYGYEYNPKSSYDVGASCSTCTPKSYRSILNDTFNWTHAWDRSQRVPYAYSSRNEWISYDNPQSISAKIEIVRNKGLKGCFFWSSNQDDYDGSSGNGKFPLMRAAYNNL